MKFAELIVLLPCHSLEDFPVHHTGVEAESLLAAWSALWHPRLLADARAIPTWYRADAPPEELEQRLFVVPSASEPLLLPGWAARARAAGAIVVRKQPHRDKLLTTLLAALDAPAHGSSSVSVASPNISAQAPSEIPLQADFLALGSCYLWVELLTRQMRYMSNLDDVQLRSEAVAAAEAAVAGNVDDARRHLQNAFDVLAEARDRFYPVESYLIDLTLVAETTLGAALQHELRQDSPTNLLLTGQMLATLAEREPSTLDALRLAIDHGRTALVGGEYAEEPLPLLPREAVLDNLLSGLAEFERLLGKRPTVYGRRRHGLSPLLPGILERTGFRAALHFTLDDGKFPANSRSRLRWEGLDYSAVDALCRVPLDARTAESFLQLPQAVGDAMDHDQVATVVFAHWPGETSPYYEDLRRAQAYGQPLGRFVTVDDYFSQTDQPGELVKFSADMYRTPYLRQAIIRNQPDALSQSLRVHQHWADQTACDALTACAAAWSGTPPESPSSPAVAAERLARQLFANENSPAQGMVVFNTLAGPRRAVVDITRLETMPVMEGPVVALQASLPTDSESRRFALVDLPAGGFAWLAASASVPPAVNRKAATKPLAEGLQLRNERFEVTLDEHTGSIRSVHTLNGRGNRLAQQLAFRLPTPRSAATEIWSSSDEAAYSVAAVDAIDVSAAGPAFGELVSRGRLLDHEGGLLARFVQRYRLERGSRTLWIDVELEILEPPRADAWNSYYAVRWAWNDETAELRRGLGLTAQEATGRRLEAPEFIEIGAPRPTLALLTGGLPYHQRSGTRMLDTLLVVRGESARKFRLGAVIDPIAPAAHALDLLTAPAVASGVPLPNGQNGSGWLWQVEPREVVSTRLLPTVADGRVTGLRVRIVETSGLPTRAVLRTFRDPIAARQVDLLGQQLAVLATTSDRVEVDLAGGEWVDIEIMF